MQSSDKLICSQVRESVILKLINSSEKSTEMIMKHQFATNIFKLIRDNF